MGNEQNETETEIEVKEGDEELEKFDKFKEEEAIKNEERKEKKRKYNAIQTWMLSEDFIILVPMFRYI